MKVRLFRSRKVELQLLRPSVDQTEGLFFDFTLGIEGPVDPESGMVLNLVEVEHILDRLEKKIRSQVWTGPEAALLSLPPYLENLKSMFLQASWYSLSLSRSESSVEIFASLPAVPHLLHHTKVLRESKGVKRELEIIETSSLRKEFRPSSAAPVLLSLKT